MDRSTSALRESTGRLGRRRIRPVRWVPRRAEKTALQPRRHHSSSMIGGERKPPSWSQDPPRRWIALPGALKASGSRFAALKGRTVSGFVSRPKGPCLHTAMPESRLDQLMVIARFRELGFTQRRCESCDWCWAVSVDADGNRVRSFRNRRANSWSRICVKISRARVPQDHSPPGRKRIHRAPPGDTPPQRCSAFSPPRPPLSTMD